MNLADYLKNATGHGVLATSDNSGKVDIAIYSKPHFIEDGSLAFIMRDRLTHHNLQENPYAAYMFIESGSNHEGIRLHLKKVRESGDAALIASLTRRHLSAAADQAAGAKFLVYFTIEHILPLIGGGESHLTP